MNQTEAVAVLRKALQKFIDKVDDGRARSKDSYREFKEALAATAHVVEARPIGFLRRTEHVLVFMPLTSAVLEDGTKLYTAPISVSKPLTDAEWFAKYGHEAHCNLFFLATINTEDDHCCCKAAAIKKE